MKTVSGMPHADVVRLEQSLFFEEPQFGTRITRFTMLLLFASVIASIGLISDSVASIIGAMIIAPLMTPIMGMVVALVTGSKVRFTRSFLIVISGVVLAVTIGWIFAHLMPGGWDPMLSGQVTSRTSPRLLDLLIALASGGAGAYALSRTDVADALPGAAIALSLVPPLCTVGILLADGSETLAKGAFLLFLTNFVAILLAGTITFAATGLATGSGRTRRDLRSSLVAILVVGILVAIPLRLNSRELWTNTRFEDQALSVAQTWLGLSDYEINSIDITGSTVSLELEGTGQLPPQKPLVDEINSITGRTMVVTAHIVEERNVTLSDTPTP